MAATFILDDTQIYTRFYRSKRVFPANILAYMNIKANELEQYMKANHPWKNRTGNAERGLHADVDTSEKCYRQTITLAHGADIYYGVYLEYYYGRKYAIIEPTIRIKGPEIVNDLRGMIGPIMGV